MDKQPLDGADLTRFSKLCGLFSSDHQGERANAAAMADRLLRDRGWQWTDVRPADLEGIAQIKARNAFLEGELQRLTGPFAKWGGWQGAAQFCLQHSWALRNAQRGFCMSILLSPGPRGLTAKQCETLFKLVNKFV
jgi:hypothetical protein